MGTRFEIMSSVRDEAKHVISFEHQSGHEKCPTGRQQDIRINDIVMIRIGLVLGIFQIRDVFLIGTKRISGNRDSEGMEKVSDAIVKL
jgi:hypothetical protein